MESPTTAGSSSNPNPERPVRHRSTSIIQRIVLDDDGKPADSDSSSLLKKAKRKGSTVVKAVTIPAWQFFRLVPWHAVPTSEPKSDTEIVMHFNQRPVVGICLKRYMMTEDGVAKRHNTFIDIPDSLRLPHFMVAEDARVEEESSLSMEYKLVLQSVICHRGDSVHSGHYISFARVNPKLLTDNRRHDSDPPPDYEDAQWVKFDDLAHEKRVTDVDDIKEALKQEMPYLLFYQIVPMVDVTNVSVTGSETEPPSYNDSTLNVASISTPGVDSEYLGISRPASGYFDSSAISSAGPSIRFSSELDRPPRLSLSNEEDGHQMTDLLSPDISRRGSLAFSESAGTPSMTPEYGASPAVTPSDESTAQRLSRAAAKFAKASNRSRPTSQAGESRISITISRLNLKSKSKDALREEVADSLEDGEETPVAIVAPERVSMEAVEVVKKEKEHHHHLRRSRQKSKNRASAEKDPEKLKHKGEVPDRECVVM